MRYILQDVVIVVAAVVYVATVTALCAVTAIAAVFVAIAVVMFGTVLRTLRFVGILLPIQIATTAAFGVVATVTPVAKA